MTFEITQPGNWVDYIILDGKKYKVSDKGEGSYQPIFDRQKTDEVGLTGLTILQDFTYMNREPNSFQMNLRVFISTPWPDNSFGIWTDLLAASRKFYVPMVFFDGSSQWDVTIRRPLIPLARVGANIEGVCYGIFYVQVNLGGVYR